MTRQLPNSGNDRINKGRIGPLNNLCSKRNEPKPPDPDPPVTWDDGVFWDQQTPWSKTP